MIRLIAILSVVLLSACETNSGGPAQQPADSVSMNDKVYQIGIGDGLNISVWRNEDLSVAVPVRPDGLISVPLVGDVKAAGLEPQQLATIIKKELSKYIKNPQVTVVVTNAVSSEFLHRIRVTGAVQNPTSIPYQKGMTVMDVVLLTGGLTEFAKGNDTKLYRNTQAGPKVYRVKVDDILEKGDISSNFMLQPGDIVTVPEKLF